MLLRSDLYTVDNISSSFQAEIHHLIFPNRRFQVLHNMMENNVVTRISESTFKNIRSCAEDELWQCSLAFTAHARSIINQVCSFQNIECNEINLFSKEYIPPT